MIANHVFKMCYVAVKQTLQEITTVNLKPSSVSVRGLMTAYHVSGDNTGMLQVQDCLENTLCTPGQFDTNLLTVLQKSNAKPYLLSGFLGPGLQQQLSRLHAVLAVFYNDCPFLCRNAINRRNVYEEKATIIVH